MNDDVLFEEPRVELLAVTKGEGIGPEELSTFGALGCFEEKSSFQLFEDARKSLDAEAFSKKKTAVIKNSFGMGHGSVADQNYFIFSIENLTRAATFQLCLPHYLAHLQQSLRRAKADRAFFVPQALRDKRFFKSVKETLSAAFGLYEKMAAGGVPGEDARFVLPLYTKTTIQTGGDARELTHLKAMNKQGEVPAAVSAVVDAMLKKAAGVAPNLFADMGRNYETLAWYPSSQLYSAQNLTLNQVIEQYKAPERTTFVSFKPSDEALERAVRKRDEAELANLKHVHSGGSMEAFLVPMSLACFHQATRQRTWDHSVESVYDAAARGRFVTPPLVAKSEFAAEYAALNKRMLKLYKQLAADGVPRSEAVGVLPHGLQMYDLVHVNGWNAIHSIGKRTCREAQWEIRAIAYEMAAHIKKQNPALGRFCEPQCVIYGYCPERKPCGYFDAYKKAKGV